MKKATQDADSVPPLYSCDKVTARPTYVYEYFFFVPYCR